MIGSFQTQIHVRNDTNYNQLNGQKNVETLGSCKSYPSEKTQCEEENGVELMIKAHQMIRTLSEDNQILRMHVELLTKDNKHLEQKLEKIQTQKKVCLQTNQDLLKKIQQLQIKLDGYNAKQKLYRIEKQNLIKNQNHSRNPSETNTIINNYEYKKYKEENLPDKCPNKFQLSSQICSRKLQNKTQITQQNEYQVNYKKYEYGKNEKKMNENFIKKNGDEGSNKLSKNFSCYLERNYDSLRDSGSFQRHNLEPARHSYSNLISTQKMSQDTKLPQFRRQKHDSNDISMVGTGGQNNSTINKRSQQEQFYILKNSHIRCNSPLIRKNSPLKSDKSEHQFHHHRSTGSAWTSPPQNESGVHKKFNYTNWRKTNNNMMVWRVASSNKPIMLNR